MTGAKTRFDRRGPEFASHEGAKDAKKRPQKLCELGVASASLKTGMARQMLLKSLC